MACSQPQTPQLELKSSRSFLAIKRCQRTKIGKVIKQSQSPIYKLAHICATRGKAVNAVFATIADGGRAIVVIYTEGEELIFFSFILLILIKTFDGGLVQPLAKRLPWVGYVPPSKPWRWRGKWLRHGGDVYVLVFT